MEMATAVNKFFDGVEVTDDTLCINLIQEKGIGGNFFDDMHTATHFRDVLWIPELLERSPAGCGPVDRDKDIVNSAYEKWRQILKDTQPYRLGEDKSKEIDKIVEKGTKIIMEDLNKKHRAMCG